MVKVDIVSGFLGAGKTTFMKKMVAEAYAGEKVVIAENEFGEIGIDGGFLKEAGRKDALGRPILYKTTDEFLDYFGLSSKDELPKIDTNTKEDTSETDLFQSKYKENIE